MSYELILEENGFSKAESKVYLALLKIGETKSGQIIKITSLQSSVVHNSLNSLINKGFISYILKGKIKHYSCLDPQLIQKYIKNKQENFDNILPELNLLKNKQKEESTPVEIYEGFKGLFSATLSLLEKSSKNSKFRYFSAIDLSTEAIQFFEKVDLIKKEKKLDVKGIANIASKKIFKNYKNSEIKYTNQIIPPAMNIFDDKVILFSFSKKPIAILITSKEISNQYKDMWENIWKNSN